MGDLSCLLVMVAKVVKKFKHDDNSNFIQYTVIILKGEKSLIPKGNKGNAALGFHIIY